MQTIRKQIQYAYDDIAAKIMDTYGFDADGQKLMAGAAMLRDHILECYDFVPHKEM